MFWLNPSALFALVAVAAPILIHILIQRKAERFPFPTLRFLQPTRLAAIRRHVLEDVVLLALRIAILALAAAALAGPLLITAARRQAWDRRVVRAVVIEEARAFKPNDTDRVFETTSLADGIRRATLWLDTTPPARREILIASPFPIGSITPADIAAVPGDIGVRFERTGSLPATRTVAAGRLLTAGGPRGSDQADGDADFGVPHDLPDVAAVRVCDECQANRPDDTRTGSLAYPGDDQPFHGWGEAQHGRGDGQQHDADEERRSSRLALIRVPAGYGAGNEQACAVAGQEDSRPFGDAIVLDDALLPT